MAPRKCSACGLARSGQTHTCEKCGYQFAENPEANLNLSSLSQPWRVVVWLFAGLLGVAVLPLLVSKYDSKTIKPIEDRKLAVEQAGVVAKSEEETAMAPICVSAVELASQYLYNKKIADADYKGKTLVIKAVVLSHRLNPLEVDLKTDEFNHVRAIGRDVTAFRALKPDQLVTLQCTGDGTEYPMTVSSCSIVPPQTTCIKKPTPVVHPDSSTLVKLNLTARLKAQSVLFSGTTNLKDGAFLNYEVQHENINVLQGFEGGKLIVKGGRYAGTANVAGWPPGEISVLIYFTTIWKYQPSWVKVQFGEGGQYMEGPTTRISGPGIKMAQVEKILVKQ